MEAMEICWIFSYKQPTDKCPFLSPLKGVLEREVTRETIEPLFFMNKKRPPPFKSNQHSQNTLPYYAPFGG